MLSNFPMVGNRNDPVRGQKGNPDVIELSDGGESERQRQQGSYQEGCYRTFRWWGIGTASTRSGSTGAMLSNFPMVGNRNVRAFVRRVICDVIELSDGEESEPQAASCSMAVQSNKYSLIRLSPSITRFFCTFFSTILPS